MLLTKSVGVLALQLRILRNCRPKLEPKCNSCNGHAPSVEESGIELWKLLRSNVAKSGAHVIFGSCKAKAPTLRARSVHICARAKPLIEELLKMLKKGVFSLYIDVAYIPF